MEKVETIILSLKDVSKIVADYIKNVEGTHFYSGMKVCHDDEGKIYFKFE